VYSSKAVGLSTSKQSTATGKSWKHQQRLTQRCGCVAKDHGQLEHPSLCFKSGKIFVKQLLRRIARKAVVVEFVCYGPGGVKDGGKAYLIVVCHFECW